MNDSNFVLVYEINPSALYWTLGIASTLGTIVIGIFCMIFVRLALQRNEKSWYWIPLSLISFFIFVSIIPLFRAYEKNIELVKSNNVSYVEGPVRNFVPMPYNGHANESFTVNGVPFEYSDYDLTAGFNKTASHGGPIREGLNVRIWHIGNEITKLEIERNPKPH